MPGEEVPERNEALERLRAEIAAIQTATNKPIRRRRAPLIAGLVAAAIAVGGAIVFVNRDTTPEPSADSQPTNSQPTNSQPTNSQPANSQPAGTGATNSTDGSSATADTGGAPPTAPDTAATPPAPQQTDSTTVVSGGVSSASPTPETDAPTTTNGPTTTATTTAKRTPDTVPALLQGVLDVTELPPNYSVFADGTMHNYGTVVSAKQAEAVTSKFAAIVPVDDNFVIDPSGEPATGIVYVPAGVLFASGSAQVGTEFRTTLDLATAFMQFFPQVRMTIIGHTDDVGSDARNLALSQARARTAVTFMISQGVDPARLTAEGRGESDPVAPNDTEFGRLANRRIEFVLAGLLDN